MKPQPNWLDHLAPIRLWVVILFACALNQLDCFGQSSVPLPAPVRAVWELDNASREATPTRERIYLNGLWRWQPTEGLLDKLPEDHWGYFKVPGPWPGITDYMQKDCQTLYAHPAWASRQLRAVTSAAYERSIVIPSAWAGRRIALQLENLNSFAAVFLDGQSVGEVRFPGGEVDLTEASRPGKSQRLSLLVLALPLKGVLLSYTDTAVARERVGSVPRRGLCGDVTLVSVPPGPRISNVRVDTSFRNRRLSVEVTLDQLAPAVRYILKGRVLRDGRLAKELTPRELAGADLVKGRFTLTEAWLPDDLWDIHRPSNLLDLEVTLTDPAGQPLDTAWKVPFGFRELWIEGRDFYLNGTRIFLSAVPLDNAEVSAATATYGAACESFRRLKSFGINFVYTHNYSCEPGAHLGFTEILRAADDTGMLVSLAQPHFSHYDWAGADADRTNGYARHAAAYVKTAQNHPSVVMFSMSHNATGYNEDMNPALIDGMAEARDTWAARNAKLALRAEAIVRELDPGRIVYHHASGNLGSMHTINFYPNFVPIQELSDWFEHWATQGVKPLFTCEFGAPFTWDWTMYRGWFKGQREFGSAAVPWEFCLAEWNAQFLGDSAFQVSEPEKANLRWEAQQLQAGRVWHRWDYPYPVGSTRFDERYPIFEAYLTDNWRAFRTWGVSAISPWEHEHFWKLRDGLDKHRRDLPVDWEHLQRPGYSPDYLDQQYERMDLAFGKEDWVPTRAALALLRNNRPLLAYIGGKPTRFTSKDHQWFPGESFEKQLIVLNNSRETSTCACEWSFLLPTPITGSQRVVVATGQQGRIPLRVTLPAPLPPGRYELNARFQFSDGEIQTDQFVVDVLSPPVMANVPSPVALFDPKGQTRTLLESSGVPCRSIDADADLSQLDLLIIGKEALTVSGTAPDLRQVRRGLKVIVFEQKSDVLARRLGFRIQEYGLRQAFPRVPDHPVLGQITASQLRDWRGEATLLPPQLSYEERPRHGPTVSWCGLPVTRLWRCGNQGNVASVLIEKPARGDFLPIVDGGFSLQYSPLLEFREGKGVVLFCQLDVTGRTESEPVAQWLVRNLVSYVAACQPRAARQAIYVGNAPGRTHLETQGIATRPFSSGAISPNDLLIVGKGGGKILAEDPPRVADWLKAGGHLFGLGLDQEETRGLLPFTLATMQKEHIAAFFAPPRASSWLAGVGPADVHNRAPRDLPLISAGAEIVGDGVLATARDFNAVFCQIEPWEFADPDQANLRRTHRRASFLVARLLANRGVASVTPLLDRWHESVRDPLKEQRWLAGLYTDEPREWDDPYRFFRW